MSVEIKAYVNVDNYGQDVSIVIVMLKGPEERHVLRLKPGLGGRATDQTWESFKEGTSPVPTFKLGRDAVTALADALAEFQTPVPAGDEEKQVDEGFVMELWKLERDRVTKLLDYVMEGM